jgi:hypothetical protein
MDAALMTLPLEKESPDTATGDAYQIVVPIAQREKHQINQPLGATLQMPAQTEQPLAMPAKSVEGHRHGLTVRPQHLIAFVLDLFSAAVLVRIAAEENFQRARHFRVFSGANQVGTSGGRRTDPSPTESDRQEISLEQHFRE